MLFFKFILAFATLNVYSSTCFYVEPVEKVKLKSSCIKSICASKVECVGTSQSKNVYCLENKNGKCPPADECLKESEGYEISFINEENNEIDQSPIYNSNSISK